MKICVLNERKNIWFSKPVILFQKEHFVWQIFQIYIQSTCLSWISFDLSGVALLSMEGASSVLIFLCYAFTAQNMFVLKLTLNLQ